MNWMNGRKGSWTCFADIAFVIMVLFLVLFYSVPTPSVASGLTDTPTPISTPTATDTLTQPYPSPILVSPKFGETIKGKTSFSWQWDGALQEGEWFDLQIWQPGKPSPILMRRNCVCLLDTPPYGFGRYWWQVGVVRTDASGKAILSKSRIWSFVWSDVTPTAMPISPPATPTPQPAGPITLTIYLRDTITEGGFAALSGDQTNGGMIYEEGKFVYGEAAVPISETTYHFDKPEVGPGEPEQLANPWRVEFEFAEGLKARTGNQFGYHPKKAQFWVGRLDDQSAVGEDNPYSLTMKLYEGDELRNSIRVSFSVKDAPESPGGVGGGKPPPPE